MPASLIRSALETIETAIDAGELVFDEAADVVVEAAHVPADVARHIVELGEGATEGVPVLHSALALVKSAIDAGELVFDNLADTAVEAATTPADIARHIIHVGRDSIVTPD